MLRTSGDDMRGKWWLDRSGGFTLIELLTVISIIAVLASILFPVFSSARGRARQISCVSNARQVGLAVRMYVDDNNDTWPIFHAYNTGTPHLGVEVALLPYVKATELFKCPDDSGGPAIAAGGSGSYYRAFGSSYRFTRGCFSVVQGVSTQNDQVLSSPTRIVKDGQFDMPSNTRIMRDEMLPWTSSSADPGGQKYGYAPDYYQKWHSNGATFVFADGHAEFVTSAARFDDMIVSPDGTRSIEGYWDYD